VLSHHLLPGTLRTCRLSNRSSKRDCIPDKSSSAGAWRREGSKRQARCRAKTIGASLNPFRRRFFGGFFESGVACGETAKSRKRIMKPEPALAPNSLAVTISVRSAISEPRLQPQQSRRVLNIEATRRTRAERCAATRQGVMSLWRRSARRKGHHRGTQKNNSARTDSHTQTCGRQDPLEHVFASSPAAEEG
jgi:hypothetical protein